MNSIAEIQVSYTPTITSSMLIKTSQDAYHTLIKFFPSETMSLQERFVATYLNNSNRVLGVYELSKGGITGTVVDIRLLLSVALKSAATGIILAHNHPSGNLNPSENDKLITEKIKKSCHLMDIKLLDHLIFSTGDKFLSFADEGLL